MLILELREASIFLDLSLHTPQVKLKQGQLARRANIEKRNNSRTKLESSSNNCVKFHF